MLVLNSSQPWLWSCLRAVPGLDYSKRAEKARVRVSLGWTPAGRNKAVSVAQCSKTKGLGSAGKYGLQLVLATGKCVVKRCHTDERSRSLQPGKDSWFFYQDL